jgi:hypothetical protein
MVNADRDHFLVPEARADVPPSLETYLRGVLGPAFEGG